MEAPAEPDLGPEDVTGPVVSQGPTRQLGWWLESSKGWAQSPSKNHLTLQAQCSPPQNTKTPTSMRDEHHPEALPAQSTDVDDGMESS